MDLEESRKLLNELHRARENRNAKNNEAAADGDRFSNTRPNSDVSISNSESSRASKREHKLPDIICISDDEIDCVEGNQRNSNKRKENQPRSEKDLKKRKKNYDSPFPAEISYDTRNTSNQMSDSELALMLQLQEDSHFAKEIEESLYHRNSSFVESAGITGDHLVENLFSPNPDVHDLFVQFNSMYFWGKLDTVSVKWSKRMTLCAGLCCYERKGRLCEIKLSEPLLQYRPTSDLINTLLHEMIHAYLFVTNNNRDHDSHGTAFCEHMQRINAAASTTITIYHNFREEVENYRTHWWKCDGPCAYILKRAMNRKPGPYDRWWDGHVKSCGGTFIKIKEPEKKAKKDSKKEKKNFDPSKSPTNNATNSDIRTYFN